MVWIYVLAIIIGYLIGSISPSYILGRLMKGIDIRKYGTKNAGASNAFKTIGKTAGIITVVFDMTKAAFAMLITYLMIYGTEYSFANLAGTPFAIMCLAGFAAICGHNWPFYMQFKGGKGAAAAWGIILALFVLSIMNDLSWSSWSLFAAFLFFGLSIIAITKAANITSFIMYPIVAVSMLILMPGAVSIAISLFFLYLIGACTVTVMQKKGLKNDLIFSGKRKKMVVWRKSLRFVFLVFPVLYFWIEKTPILIIFGALALIFFVFDMTRIKKNKVIRHLYKESEEKAKISGITLFLIGAFISVLFFEKNIAILAMTFATIGDNFAVLLGTQFGRHRIFKDKSAEGLIACLATSFLAGLVLMQFLNVSLILVAIGALAATIAELFSGIYDNLTMAPFAALVMSLIKF